MLLFTEVDQKGRVKTELTEIVAPSYRKYGKEKTDPSFFMSFTLINRSLYVSCNRTGDQKKFIAFFIGYESIVNFLSRLDDFVKELAQNGKASCSFSYKNKEDVPVSYELYAVIGTDDSQPSYMKTTLKQGSDEISFNSALGKRTQYAGSKGRNFFVNLSKMVENLEDALKVSSPYMVEHLAECKRLNPGTYDGKKEETYSNNTSSSYNAIS